MRAAEKGQYVERNVSLLYRVEPKGESDTFIVHGQACIASDAHPSCTHDAHSKAPPAGRTYTIDITDLMGPDLAVRRTPLTADKGFPQDAF